jgi:hypothetical protein
LMEIVSYISMKQLFAQQAQYANYGRDYPTNKNIVNYSS